MQPIGTASGHSLRQTWQQVLPLAWPFFIGQLAVIAFSTVDTMLVARYATADLAALGIGISVYITVFVGLMGVVLAIGPIAGQAFGAKRYTDAGAVVHQSVWVTLVLSMFGCAALLFPEPFLWLANASPDVEAKVRGYLQALALALPPSLLVAVFRGFNTAVSRPKIVMALQIGGLLVKAPLSLALIYGVGALPALGVRGCGVATAVVTWLQLSAAVWLLRRDDFYTRFAIHRAGEWLRPVHWPTIRELLRLGLPMGAAFALEVAGFSFMAFFISRVGTTAVAGHQIAVNLVSIMFMVALALSNAVATLVAQRVGAGDTHLAHRMGWHGMIIVGTICSALAVAVFVLREPIVHLYSGNAAIVAAALPLLGWLAFFHVADALQTMAAAVLRSWRIATMPMVIYAVCLWGVGLGGGWLLLFTAWGRSVAPSWAQGASGYWVASSTGLLLAAIALTAVMVQALPRPHAAATQS